jgi:hypothetical protein
MGYASYSKASVKNYSSRGMNAGSDDFAFLDFSGIESYGGRLTATFFDRRLEFYGYHYRGGSTLERVRDSDGDVVIDIDDPDESHFRTSALGMLIDPTDDYSDPRRGGRLDVGPPRVSEHLGVQLLPGGRGRGGEGRDGPRCHYEPRGA